MTVSRLPSVEFQSSKGSDRLPLGQSQPIGIATPVGRDNATQWDSVYFERALSSRLPYLNESSAAIRKTRFTCYKDHLLIWNVRNSRPLRLVRELRCCDL
jgi:hypothetical protein